MSEAENGTGTLLEGARVDEMGSLLEGPFCGQLLADLGAEVIKAEPPCKVRWTGPKLGQHDAEIYEKVLGLGEEELNSLRERGII